MKTSKQFMAEKKTATGEIKKAASSIFYWRKQLLALARKNDFCEGKDINKVITAVMDITKGGQKLDVNVFFKDYQGRFCYVSKYSGKVDEASILSGEIVTAEGKEVRVSKTGEGYVIYRPVVMTLTGVFNAYCAVAAKVLKEYEKAEKEAACMEQKLQREAEKEAKKAAKIKERKVKELQKAFEKGILTATEYNNKMKAIK